jgi:hypothetical protein
MAVCELSHRELPVAQRALAVAHQGLSLLGEHEEQGRPRQLH